MDEVFNIAIPVVCSGRIRSYSEDDNLYEVNIYESPLDALMFPIPCKLLYQPGLDDNFQAGAIVKVLLTFAYSCPDFKPLDVYGGEALILGMFHENAISNKKTRHPVSGNKGDFGFVNPRNGAGLVTNDKGDTILSTAGTIKSVLSPFGHGVEENGHKVEAMNHHRIISHNVPYYQVKEHFGMYKGKDDDDKSTRGTMDDTYFLYRRYVNQTEDPVNWVSTCEGTWDPWVGPNNDSTTVKKSRDVLFTKIINSGTNRITIEGGEEGDGFFTIRIDTIALSERHIPVEKRATPSVAVGNKFKLQVSEEGNLKIFSSGHGIPTTNLVDFKLETKTDGSLDLWASGKISLTHGDVDEAFNSIVIDPAKGIDVTAKNGFRVNGKKVLTEEFLAFIIKHQADLCLTTGIGAPAPLNPTVIAELLPKSKLPMSAGGFDTSEIGPPATGIIKAPEVPPRTIS